MITTNQPLDTGTGYGRPQPTYNRRLTEVGPGTPMGELMRRYWQPVARVEDATSTPQRVRILGEDLVLFRDGEGRPGLVAEHCSHRGTSLFFGRVEQDGIRCCYHGWKFDVQGHCLDQATEVDGGRRRDVARQPWYPVEERYGLVFAYMGPPEKKPVLPRWASLEDLEDGQFIEVSTYPGYGPSEVMDYNWLQSFENVMDQMHAIWLHAMHSGQQFIFESDVVPSLPDNADVHGAVMTHRWELTESGVTSTGTFPTAEPGMFYAFTVETVFPNGFSVPGFDDMSWIVPVDDTHHLVFQLGAVSKPGTMAERQIRHDGKTWAECSPEELRAMPGDYEAQRSQGEVAFHSAEHLAASDQGVVLVRRGLGRLLDDLEAGKEPAGVSFDPAEPPRKLAAGSGLIRPVTEPAG